MKRRGIRETLLRLSFVLCSVSIIFFSQTLLAQKKERPDLWDWRHVQRWHLRPNLKTAHLQSGQRAAIFNVSREAFAEDKDWSENEPESESVWDDIIWSERIRLVDMDGDGVPEVLLWGAGPESSGDGNSTFRILKKFGATYKILYDGYAEALNIDRRSDPTHPIIVLYGHDSVWEGSIELYQIGRDGVFRLLGAYNVKWPQGQFEGRDPTLTPTTNLGTHHDH